jgi:hypothetical protein
MTLRTSYVVVAMLFLNILGLEAAGVHRRELLSRLESAAAVGLKKKPDAGDLAAVGSTIMAGGKDETWAIMQCRIWGQTGRLHLRWWESTDSINRQLIVIIMLVDMDEELRDGYMDRVKGYAARFDPKEREERRREIDSAVALLSDKDVINAIRHMGR